MKKSEEKIKEKRRKKESVFLVTGATGFLGSHITFELLREGYKVITVCRAHKDLSASERMGLLMDWYPVESSLRNNLTIIEGSLDDTNLGLDNNTYQTIAQNIDEVVHCASNTSFSERNRKAVEKANNDNLKNIIYLVENSGCYYFHHLSTAYVAGKIDDFCPEEFQIAHNFFNVYEETKYLQEKYLLRECSRSGVRLNIYRPTIVYGNSETGKTLRFNALYYPIKTLLFLKQLYEKDLKDNHGEKAKALGVQCEEGNNIYLPIRLETCEKGTLNLIPVDFFLKAWMTLMESEISGNIFHIANSYPTRLDEVIEYTRILFGISGINKADRNDFDHIPKNALEILFDSYIDVYRPYIKDTRVFNTDKSDAILNRHNIYCPRFSFEIFEKCMKYAISVMWQTPAHG
ncbi:MAG: SDR family oxidoreductase [Desulfamplus sp.]|nr:SDR family oxidoreductase [Desulfamplus sp.]